MLQTLYYAEKLDEFFNKSFDKKELHYKIAIQLNFSIEVYLYMKDALSLNRDNLKDKYLEFLKKVYPKKQDLEALRDADFKVYFEYGAIKFFLNEFDDSGENGDPGENGSGILYGPRYRLSSLLNHETDRDADLPTVVTFYSYKGGMGRTTTLMGFALWLAHKGKKVGIIDCDLEAPGYLNFFNLGEQKQFVDGNKNGFVEFVGDSNFLWKYNARADAKFKGNDPIDIKNYTVIPIAPESNQEAGRVYDNICIVPGGNLNEAFTVFRGEVDNESEVQKDQLIRAEKNRKHYIEGLSRINLSDPNVLKKSFRSLIKKLREEFEVDVMLIDSRTGFNDIYGSTAFDLADHIVAFFGFSKQTIPGLRQLLDTYAHKIKDTGESRKPELTLCNSILPSRENLDRDGNLERKWVGFMNDFSNQVNTFCQINDIPAPDIMPIHRRQELEELGMDSQSDLNFFKMVINDWEEDYMNLFSTLYNSLADRNLFPEKASENESTETIQPKVSVVDSHRSNDNITSLQLTKIILRELKTKLEQVKNFAENMDVLKTENFLYRDCMRHIFDPDKFIIRGFKGAGKTCMYKALGSDEVALFIQRRALGSSTPQDKYKFINVINFERISDHPLKVLETIGVFEGAKFYNINALWQFLMWSAVFTDKQFEYLLPQSRLKEFGSLLTKTDGATTLKQINTLIEEDVLGMLSAIEEDMRLLDQHLEDSQQELFVMYDGLDNVVKPKYWSKAISPLINKWGGNLAAYQHIHPKIFLRTDLFERIEGTNTERLKDNIIDIDWNIAEVFGYLFKLVLGEKECPSRNAMWSILQRLRPDTADATIDNWTKGIRNGQGQFPTFDLQNLKFLVGIFFGKEVTPQGANLGHPWSYFEKQLANAAGKISLRLFINTLTTDVLTKGLENSNKHVHEVISPEIYAAREVRIKAAESYFNDMASEEDFTDDLLKVRDFINSEHGKDFRLKILNEEQFNKMREEILRIYKDSLHAVDNTDELAQLIYASGLMKEIYKPGRKIYRFAPMYEYAWGLAGKSEDDESQSSQAYKRNSPYPQRKRSEKVKEWDVLEGVLEQRRSKLYVTCDNKLYKCKRPYPLNISLGVRVRFTIENVPKPDGSQFLMATHIEPI